MICPATRKGCCDDLCYGGGCLRMHGESMLIRCDGCGHLVAADGSDNEECTCEPDDGTWWEGD